MIFYSEKLTFFTKISDNITDPLIDNFLFLKDKES